MQMLIDHFSFGLYVHFVISTLVLFTFMIYHFCWLLPWADANLYCSAGATDTHLLVHTGRVPSVQWSSLAAMCILCDLNVRLCAIMEP